MDKNSGIAQWGVLVSVLLCVCWGDSAVADVFKVTSFPYLGPFAECWQGT